MSVSGLCQVCQTAEAIDRCESCGSLVCREHYEPGVGQCVECTRAGGGRQI
ncbi:MAG: hypothetical protein ABEH65_01940 [Halobacteriales archaeon]